MRKLFLLLTLLGVCTSIPAVAALESAIKPPYAAPEITNNGEWFNSPPLSLKKLKGQVVLVDFWTYSCINCLRTFPYLKAWYQQYKDKGFVIVGVHTPEFEFEKNKANVEKALRRFELTYPVVQDNDRTIWDRYQNQYWPAHYLINKQGQVVYIHFGEGNYDITEKRIRELLDEKGDMSKLSDTPDGYSNNETHETYLGTDRAERLVTKEPLATDQWILNGKWKRSGEHSQASEAGAAIKINFRGGKVFLVLGTANGKPTKANILLDGKPVTDFAGKDVKDGMVHITEHRLYELIDLKKNGEGVLEIQASEPGLRAYAFTFGGY